MEILTTIQVLRLICPAVYLVLFTETVEICFQNLILDANAPKQLINRRCLHLPYTAAFIKQASNKSGLFSQELVFSLHVPFLVLIS